MGRASGRQAAGWRWPLRLMLALVDLYCLGLLSWKMLHWLAGDRWHWLFLVTSFAPALFAPALLLPLVAWWGRQRRHWLALATVAGLWLSLYGPLWLPRATAAPVPGRTLTVMTYNMLVANLEPRRVIAVIRASGADVVAFQEMNSTVAIAVLSELTADYPYQALVARDDYSGHGLISRYPLHEVSRPPSERWVSQPQELDLDLGGQRVRLINFHALSPSPHPLDPAASAADRWREDEARDLVTRARAHPGPLLALGDLNATPLSTAHAIIAAELADSWPQVGWGLGHTWPGAASPGSPVPTLFGLTAPLWLVRIDYIFHSAHWRPVAAEIGQWDGVSDHRPVIARLTLSTE